MAYYNEKAEVMRMKKGKEDDRDKTDCGGPAEWYVG